MFSIFLNMKVCCVFSLEMPHQGDSNVHTQYTIFIIRKENHPRLSQICSYGIFFQGAQERVRNRHGKRAISVRATEVLLYLKKKLGHLKVTITVKKMEQFVSTIIWFSVYKLLSEKILEM